MGRLFDHGSSPTSHRSIQERTCRGRLKKGELRTTRDVAHRHLAAKIAIPLPRAQPARYSAGHRSGAIRSICGSLQCGGAPFSTCHCRRDAEEAAALLRRDNSRDWKTPLKSAILTEAVAWSGGHPYFLQCLGAELAQRSDFQGRRIDAKALAAYDAVLDISTVREIVREDHLLLTPPQQALVAALCADASPLSVEALSARTGLAP